MTPEGPRVVVVTGWTERRTLVMGRTVYVAPQASPELERALAEQAVKVAAVLMASPAELACLAAQSEAGVNS